MFSKLLQGVHLEEHQAYQFQHNHQFLQLVQQVVVLDLHQVLEVLVEQVLLQLLQELVQQELLDLLEEQEAFMEEEVQLEVLLELVVLEGPPLAPEVVVGAESAVQVHRVPVETEEDL
jgi:hypothetical protein